MLSEFGIVKRGWSRWTALVITAGLAAACVDETVAPAPETGPTPAPAKPRVIGFAELTFSGIGTPDLAPSLLIAPTLEELEALRAQRERSGDLRDVVSQDLTFPRNGDGSTGDGTIQLQLDEPENFPFDGVRYVSATFDVRNAQSDGTAYDIPHTNITFLPVSTNGTINQTAVRKLEVGDGSPDARALQVLPTDRLEVVGDTLRASHPDVLQILRETEVAAVLGALPASAGVTSVFPYGFVVRRAGDNTTRELPAPSDNTFPGRVDFAFSIPDDAGLQTLSVLMVAVVDSETRLTQGPQEQTGAAQASLEQLAATLVGTDTVTLLPGGGLAPPAGVGLRTLCGVRTAGAAGAATAYLVNVTGFQSFSPTPNSFIPADTAFQAMFNTAVFGIGPNNFTVRGSQSGRAFSDTTYSGNGTNTITTPRGSFFAGEQVEIELPSPCPAPQLAQYTVQPDTASGGFLADSTYEVGGDRPQSIAIGDLNRDGALDLAIANQGSNNVSILLNNPESVGIFSLDNTYAVGTNPQSIAIADLNGDGSFDLAVANQNSDSVSVLLNSGNGTFPPNNPTYSTGSGPQSVAADDLNGDGSPDLAVTNYNDTTVSVLLNNNDGSGTFLPDTTYGVGSNPASVAIADLNGDGSLDLAIANQGPGNVSVALNNNDGTGTFQPDSMYGLGDVANAPRAVAVADLNRDGSLDLVTANQGTSNISLLLNNNAGRFQPDTTYHSGPSAVYVATGDVNGDGMIDIVVPAYSQESLAVFLNNNPRPGRFQPTSVFRRGMVPASVAIGDLNADGRLDLVVANDATPGTIMIFLGSQPCC